MDKCQSREMISRILLVLGILIFLLFIIIANIFHFNYIMNSDLASDVILAKLIWTSKQIIPSTWYIAAETRIICTPNLAALFYGLTQNMTLATGLACSLMTVLILAGIIYFGRKAGLSKIETGLLAFLGLAIPINMAILELLYLFASYYAIHVVILFLTLGSYAESIRKRKTTWASTIISVALALCLGVQGVRGILVIYGPLFGIEAIRVIYHIYIKEKIEKQDLGVSIWVICLLIVSFIGTCFPFSVGQSFSRNIRKGFQKLFTVVIPDMETAIGFSEVNIIGKICLGTMLLVIVYLLIDIAYCMWKRKAISAVQWAFLVICASPVVTAMIVSFTTIESCERYYFLLVYAMAFAQMLLWRKIRNGWRSILGVLIAALAMINICTVYWPIIKTEEPPATDAYAVGKYLEGNGYHTAYATFEIANKITVLTNGQVRVAAVESLDKMNICKWMTSTDWYVPNIPFEEKTAYIVLDSQMEMFTQFLAEHEGDVHLETEIGNYWIYVSDYNFSRME